VLPRAYVFWPPRKLANYLCQERSPGDCTGFSFVATSWMIERLTSETRIHHANADTDLDGLFRNDVTSTHYLMFLMRAYGFEAPLESALAMTPNLDMMLDLRPRSRAGFLAQDMMALSLRPADVTDLPLCFTIPQFRSIAEAMGWLYVAERTTLAHNVIRRHLMTRLPLEMEIASSYLSSYDGIVGKRWQELGAAFDEVAQHPAIAERIVQSAGDAFRARRNWLSVDTVEQARSAS
jgi:heme oxygenase